MVFRSQIVLYFECFCIAWNLQTALFNITACNVFHCTYYYYCVYKGEMGCYRCVYTCVYSGIQDEQSREMLCMIILNKISCVIFHAIQEHKKI